MNTLVTGSNGFIGSHVCDYLSNHGINVIGLGRSEKFKSNCQAYIKCNLASNDINNIPNELIDLGFDHLNAVVHLAASLVEYVVFNGANC